MAKDLVQLLCREPVWSQEGREQTYDLLFRDALLVCWLLRHRDCIVTKRSKKQGKRRAFVEQGGNQVCKKWESPESLQSIYDLRLNFGSNKLVQVGMTCQSEPELSTVLRCSRQQLTSNPYFCKYRNSE